MKIPHDALSTLRNGAVIPALPLALNRQRKLDERRQRGLFRYYLEAGAGGIAVAVHTTQFAVRSPEVNLLVPLLEIADDEFSRFEKETGKQPVRIAGVIGKTGQAVREAELAAGNGFHAALLSVAAFKESSNEEIINHCKTIAGIIPLIGFYLQPAVGGRKLDPDFWREFGKIPEVIAVKVAPFNRYYTLDVIRGLAESGRAEEIALYTGNDDNILMDLLSEYRIETGGNPVTKKFTGGLLGHWAVWTHTAVELLNAVKNGEFDKDVKKALILANQITDCNSAFFDTTNDFKGCITGLHEVLRRQGLFEGIWTLDSGEMLSPGQKEEIDRVYKSYPHLNDDEFVKANIGRWLS